MQHYIFINIQSVGALILRLSIFRFLLLQFERNLTAAAARMSFLWGPAVHILTTRCQYVTV